MKKKIMILVTIMTVGLTACVSKEEAKVCIADRTTNVNYDLNESDSEYVEFIHDEEELEELKNDAITYIEANWEEEEGIPSKECKDEIIEMVKSINCDPNLINGYDLELLQVRYVNILVEYGVLPESCIDKTFNEIDEINDEFI